MSSIAKLIALTAKFEGQDWSCEFQGKSFNAGRAKISQDGGVATLTWSFDMEGQARHFVVGEHINGGGDWLKVDGAEHDADHEISFRWKAFPPSTKITVKSSYDMDGLPGLEEVIKFATKIRFTL